MEAVACQRILALQEPDPTHLRHHNDGAAHPAVRAGAAADRIEAVDELASKRTAPQWHWPARTLVSLTVLPC